MEEVISGQDLSFRSWLQRRKEFQRNQLGQRNGGNMLRGLEGTAQLCVAGAQ